MDEPGTLARGTKVILHFADRVDIAEIIDVFHDRYYVTSFDHRRRAENRQGTFGMDLYFDQFNDPTQPLWFEVTRG